MVADALIRAEDVSAARRWTAFAFLMVAEFFYGWSWNTVDILRPQIRDQLGLTLTQAGSTYTAQSLGALVGAITGSKPCSRRRICAPRTRSCPTKLSSGPVMMPNCRWSPATSRSTS